MCINFLVKKTHAAIYKGVGCSGTIYHLYFLFLRQYTRTMILRWWPAMMVMVVAIFSMTIHAFYLRKQPHHVTNSVKNESSVVLSMHNTSQNDDRTEDALKAFIHDEACGIGVLTCMAFAHDQHKKIPVLCGTLKNAPVCLGPSGKKCDAFCDADG